MAYSLVAVDFLPDPAISSSLRRLAIDLANGTLNPLPRIVHEVSSVQAALRQMSQARHTGKIVVRTPTLSQAHSEADRSAVVVTGGLGMIGSIVGSWLACQGVSDVVLLGRSGRPSADAMFAVQEVALGGGSTGMHMVRCDASSVEEVTEVARAATAGKALQVRGSGVCS